MQKIDSDQRLRELYDTGQGYIYNDFEGGHQTASSRESNKLHRATCEECDPRRSKHAMTVNTQGQKLFFANMSEAFKWLMTNRAGNWSKCLRCNP